MNKNQEPRLTVEQFVPDLWQAFTKQPLDLRKIILVTLPVKDPKQHRNFIPVGMDRHLVALAANIRRRCF